MNNNKTELLVAALENGTVIDHIPSELVFTIASLLELDKLSSSVTIGYNLNSKKLGKKGIIKVADKFFTDEEISRLSIVAPNVVLNVIRNFDVVEKKEVIIPTGHFMFEEGDRIHLTSDAKTLRDFLAEINLVKSPLRNIMIVGGSKIGYYLANELSKKKYKIKLIESNRQTADELADELPRVTVVRGNGTSHDLLLEEGIEAMDAFVALTDIDEENMVVSMFANKMNVKKTITQIKGDDLIGMLDELGIKNTVSPREIVANRIISYIRAIANTKGSNVLTLYRLVNDQVEAMVLKKKK